LIAIALKRQTTKRVSRNNNVDLTRLKGKHILLCEDNAINQEIAQTILREKGILVTIAMDGNDGLRKFEQSSYGYYLLDPHGFKNAQDGRTGGHESHSGKCQGPTPNPFRLSP
jgi:PleD family two-component response regulator